MDRQIAFAVLFATGCTGLLGLYYFTGSTPKGTPVYAPQDIRYSMQKNEEKRNKRNKSTTSSSDATSDAGEDVDENIIEEPPAEEPPIE